LSEALAEPSRSNVSTIYKYETADKTFDLIQNFKGQGEAVFTQPFGPVKCAGGKFFSSHNPVARSLAAPQKMAYMAHSYWQSTGNKYSSSFITGMPTMFAQPHYSKALEAIRESKDISGTFNTNLVEVRPDTKTAIFEVLAGENKGKKIEKEFGLLHVVPPMGPLDFIKSSPLADGAGWVDVDAGTLQHKKYENVFSLGDASSLPTSKVSVPDRNDRGVADNRPPPLSPLRPLSSHTT